MSSDYFNYALWQMSSGQRARSKDVNDALGAIDTGFALLPDIANVNAGKINYAVDSGAADAYVVSLPSSPISYVDGMEVVFKASASNTGASTINCNGLGARTITKHDGTALSANDILINKISILRYNTTSGNFELQGT